MENLYRIEEETTIGWELIENQAVKLTREQATDLYYGYIAEGKNPDRIRIRVDND